MVVRARIPSSERLNALRCRLRRHPDALALTGLVALTLLVAWNRIVCDGWLPRFDLFTQIIPWYAYLGEQLRAGHIPGWNPHQLSGTPFAGHPLSGWMYAPAMVVFAVLPALVGFKVYMTAHLLLAAVSTYAFARVLRLRIVAALVAAVAFAFGPFLEWTTYTSLQFAQFAVWVPLALLGIELAMQRPTWRDRFLPWGIAAFAFSQMLAGWVGEGWIYALLLTGGYLCYRGVCDPPTAGRRWKQRLVLTTLTGCAVLGGGLALAAAGVLPRLSVTGQTSVHDGDYSAVGHGGILNPPWSATYLLTQILGLGDGYHFRAAQFGSAVAVLALIALILSPRRFGVPFFAVVTAAALMLTLPTTPVHRAFYLIPGYQELHRHDPWRAIALAGIAPAMLSGAAVHALVEGSRARRSAPLIVLAGGAIACIALALQPSSGVVRWGPPLAAFAVMLLALALLLTTDRWSSAARPPWRSALLPGLILLAVLLQPTGLELSGSWLGWPPDQRWVKRWDVDPKKMQALQTQLAATDPDGVGAFLQAQLASGQPFRYLGYGGVNRPNGGWYAASYMTRRFDPDVESILVNSRSLMLGLYDIQSYDPIQLSRYVDLIQAANGKAQDYHTAFIDDQGLASPLLDLLDVRYVLVPDSLSRDRPEVADLVENSKAVYQAANVTVYEREAHPADAWIVHDVRSVAPDTALELIANGSVNLHRTALIEGTAPQIPPESNTKNDRATVTDYEPDRIQIDTHSSVRSFLLISEIYADGWSATVNGKSVSILPADHSVRGVIIPPGDAVVVLHYAPRSLRIGLAISILAALLLAGVVLDAVYRRGHSS